MLCLGQFGVQIKKNEAISLVEKYTILSFIYKLIIVGL